MDEAASRAGIYAVVARQAGARAGPMFAEPLAALGSAPYTFVTKGAAHGAAKAAPAQTGAATQIKANGRAGELERIAPVGANVFTPFGIGKVESIRQGAQAPFEVSMDWGGRAFLNEDSVSWKKRLFEMSDQEKVEASIEHKQKGKALFGSGRYADAICEYELSLIYARQVKDEGVKLQLQVKPKVVVPCHQNIALARIKLGEFGMAVEAASEALRELPDSVKALYFRAKANRGRGMHKEARADLDKAMRMEPNNLDVRRELVALKEEVKEAKEADKKAFGGFLNIASNGNGNGAAHDDASAHKRPIDEAAGSSALAAKRSRMDRHAGEATQSNGTAAANGAAPSAEDSGPAKRGDDSGLPASLLVAAAAVAVLAAAAVIVSRRR